MTARGRPRRILWRFRDAGRGLVGVWRTQANMRVHVLLAGLALFVAWGEDKGGGDMAVLAGLIALVGLAESVNTAVERTVDLCSPRPHPLARMAKEAAAGGVLVAALGAAAAGVWLLGPGLVRLVRLRHRPVADLVIWGVILALCALQMWWPPVRAGGWGERES